MVAIHSLGPRSTPSSPNTHTRARKHTHKLEHKLPHTPAHTHLPSQLVLHVLLVPSRLRPQKRVAPHALVLGLLARGLHRSAKFLHLGLQDPPLVCLVRRRALVVCVDVGTDRAARLEQVAVLAAQWQRNGQVVGGVWM